MDGSNVPTKQELFNMCKPSEARPHFTDENIIEILQATRNQLRKQLEGSRNRRRRKKVKRAPRMIHSK